MTTGTRPADVHIDDLADPHFTPEVDEMRTAMAAMASEVALERDALLQAADAQTGLSDFGDDGFRERLDVLCTALRTEAGLSPQGVVSNCVQLTQLLKNRLLVEDVLHRHPEI